MEDIGRHDCRMGADKQPSTLARGNMADYPSSRLQVVSLRRRKFLEKFGVAELVASAGGTQGTTTVLMECRSAKRPFGWLQKCQDITMGPVVVLALHCNDSGIPGIQLDKGYTTLIVES